MEPLTTLNRVLLIRAFSGWKYSYWLDWCWHLQTHCTSAREFKTNTLSYLLTILDDNWFKACNQISGYCL